MHKRGNFGKATADKSKSFENATEKAQIISFHGDAPNLTPVLPF